MNAIIDRFYKTIEKLDVLFMKHYPTKGDSWQDPSKENVLFLRRKLMEEFMEYNDTEADTENELKELLDTILVAMMLAEKIALNIPSSTIDTQPLVDILNKNKEIAENEEKRNVL